MISLAALAELADAARDRLDLPVAPVRLGDREIDSDEHPVVMGVVNLSRDSGYRDSIATSADNAVRRGLLLVAQGADLVDLGAESSDDGTDRVGVQRQIDQLAPVVERLAREGVAVSAETYEPEVARACLEAGASVINFTGRATEAEVYDLVAQYDATIVLCSILGAHARDFRDIDRDGDPVPGYLDHFTERVSLARSRGVDRIVLDPGIGFYFANLVEARTRIDYQTRVLLRTFELRTLGLPIAHALPHAFDLFEEQYRVAEPFFGVLARIGGTGVFRTHEVAALRATLDTLQLLSLP